MEYKAMYKSRLASKVGVSRRTFYTWIQNDLSALEQMGVKRTSKLLTPKAVEYLCDKYSISL